MTGNGCAFSDQDFKAGAMITVLLSGAALLAIVCIPVFVLAWAIDVLIDGVGKKQE